MPPMQVMAMDPLFSNHSPLGLLVEEQRDTKKKPFRFYNCLGKHPNLRSKVQASWQIQGRGMKGVWKNLKLVRREIQKLNQYEFMGVSNRVKQLRRELIDKQSHMRVVPIPQSMLEEEKILKVELVKWSLIEKNIYKQNSIVQWLKLGNPNTAYFFASMKGRKAQNQINMHTKKDGQVIRDPSKIPKEAMEFYRRMLGQITSHMHTI
ncbi:hypothetical protein R3W88_024160 [Solanum pinnatisectum]|uniref:Uncharacterized protein n=1 Tax=Solanum pinnatisectum TaxID=50273 RepID=A0AAV9M3B6_9SOLN|nr:hypothetical protein R3W88_024160 [Solanum pinnatisectum]